MVADGTAAGSFEDGRRVNGISAITPFIAMEFATVQATSGSQPGPALEEMVKHVSSPVLLVAAGSAENPFGEAYDRAAGDRPLDVRYLADVGHTAAILRVAPPLRRAAREPRFGSAKTRRGAFRGPLIFPQSVFVAGAPAVHPRPVHLEALPAIPGLFAQLVEPPRPFVHQRPLRPRRSGARAARSSKRLRTCANSRARFRSALSELAALGFLRRTGIRRVSLAV